MRRNKLIIMCLAIVGCVTLFETASHFLGDGDIKDGALIRGSENILPLMGDNGSYGYVNLSGRWVVPPDLAATMPVIENRGAIRSSKNMKWGFVDQEGRTCIECQFDLVRDFSEGIAAVLRDGKWGFIDLAGDFLISPQFDNAGDFSEGLAAVNLGGKWTDYRRCFAGGNWGYVDREGEIVIEMRFGQARAFSEGRAAVTTLDGGSSLWGFIDKKGVLVIAPEIDYSLFEPGRFSEGLVRAPIGDKKSSKLWKQWGFLDRSGNIVIGPRFDWAYGFSENLAAVWINGLQIGPARYLVFDSRDTYDFSGGEWIYINKEGKTAISLGSRCGEPPGDFHEGLAKVQIAEEGAWGYINVDSHLVIDPQFDHVSDFASGVARAWIVSKKMGHIDKRGDWIY